MAEERFDGMLLGLAQQTRGIDDLLDTFFGFLRRKTDFFVAEESTIQKTIMKSIEKHSSLAAREKVRKAASKETKPKSTAPKNETSNSKVDSTSKDVATASSEASSAGSTSLDTTSDDIEAYNKNPAAHGNGGKGEGYWWTQTLQEVYLYVPIEPGIKSRDIEYNVKSNHFHVGIRGQPKILDGDLCRTVIPVDCYWTLEDSNESPTGRVMSIYFQKQSNMEWWDCIVQGEPKIDTSKVEPENSKLGDLDAETRKTVEKMMFDQRQKAMGLPSSDDLQKQNMVEKFMKAHPEMDFSNAKIT